MRKKIYLFIVYINLISLFSSCNNLFNFGFDLYELAHFRKDGSGKFELIFSLDRVSKIVKIGEYMAQDHIRLVRLLLEDAFLTTSEGLKSIPDIYHVSSIHDLSMLHFKLSFNFRNIEALNQALIKIKNNVDPPDIPYITMNENKFVRVHPPSLKQLIEYYKSYDDSLIKSFDLKFFFRNMQYIIRYSFDKKIRKATHPLATISKDRKSMTIINHILNPKENLDINKIFFVTTSTVKKIKKIHTTK